MFDEYDGMKLEKLRALQEQRLKKVMRHCCDSIPMYKKRFKDAGLEPDQIKGLSDLHKIPFTVKDDLRDHYPYGILGVPVDQVVRFHASSGTTGKPTTVGFTAHDLDIQTALMARSLAAYGATKKDIVQNAYTYGLFTGGLMFHYGAEKLGAAVIPSSTGNTKRQLTMMKDLASTVMCCTPSYSLRLAEVAVQLGYDIENDFKLRIGAFGAEPWSDAMRKSIEERLHIKAYDMYGLSELGGPGVAAECTEQNGLHIWSDHYIVETIDTETKEPLEPGKRGELVFTSLTKEAVPLLRYRTRDMSVLTDEECACGRCHPRLMRIAGRDDDMLIVGGINVFPSAIEEVLQGFGELADEYQIIVDRDVLDRLSIKVEASRDGLDLADLALRVSGEMQSVLTIRAAVEIVDYGTLPRAEGKSKRVIDKRSM
jgi:phenylacetate-CoA ligase